MATKDPLRGVRGTIKVDFNLITEDGLTIHARGRRLRCTPKQRARFEALLQEMYDGTPELRALAVLRVLSEDRSR